MKLKQYEKRFKCLLLKPQYIAKCTLFECLMVHNSTQRHTYTKQFFANHLYTRYLLRSLQQAFFFRLSFFSFFTYLRWCFLSRPRKYSRMVNFSLFVVFCSLYVVVGTRTYKTIYLQTDTVRSGKHTSSRGFNFVNIQVANLYLRSSVCVPYTIQVERR